MRKLIVTEYFLQGVQDVLKGHADEYKMKSVMARLNVLLCDYRQEEFYLIALKELIKGLDDSNDKKVMMLAYNNIIGKRKKWTK